MQLWALPLGFALNGLFNLYDSPQAVGNVRGVVHAFADPRFVTYSAVFAVGSHVATPPPSPPSYEWYSRNSSLVSNNTVSISLGPDVVSYTDAVLPDIEICHNSPLSVFTLDHNTETCPSWAGETSPAPGFHVVAPLVHATCPADLPKRGWLHTAALRKTVRSTIISARDSILAIRNWWPEATSSLDIRGLFSLSTLSTRTLETYPPQSRARWQSHTVPMSALGLPMLIGTILSWVFVFVYDRRGRILRAMDKIARTADATVSILTNGAVKVADGALFVHSKVSRF